jgi:hypothetical protein
MIFAFATLGFLLEGLHAFKLPLYLDVGAEPRRLMWTLAHAHGVLLGLVQIGLALSQRALALSVSTGWSRLLAAGSLLIPLGFFIGGFGIAGGDPGPGVLIVPVGAIAVIAALGQFTRQVFQATHQ